MKLILTAIIFMTLASVTSSSACPEAMATLALTQRLQNLRKAYFADERLTPEKMNAFNEFIPLSPMKREILFAKATVPPGLSPEETSFFKGALDFFRDKEKPFGEMENFQIEVQLLVSEGQDVKRAREHVLARWEKDFGFGPVKTLENRFYSSEEFESILRSGSLFFDRAGANLFQGLNQAAFRSEWLHADESHRIQWHLLMRYVRAHPEYFGGSTDVLRFYKSSHVVWLPMVDSFENNFSSPGFLNYYRQYWPLLGDWR